MVYIAQLLPDADEARALQTAVWAAIVKAQDSGDDRTFDLLSPIHVQLSQALRKAN